MHKPSKKQLANLKKRCSSNDPHVVAKAMSELIAISPGRLHLLSDSIKRISSKRGVELINAIVKQKDPALTPLLIEAMNGTDSYKIKIAIAESLWKLKDASAIPVLIQTLKTDYNARNAAMSALFKIGQPAISALIGEMKNASAYDMQDYVEMLGKINHEQCIPPLLSALSYPNVRIKDEAARKLRIISLNNPDSIEWDHSPGPLIHALEDKRFPARRHVILTIGTIGFIDTIPSLINALRVRDLIPTILNALELMVGKFTTQEKLQDFEEKIQDGSGNLRKIICQKDHATLFGIQMQLAKLKMQISQRRNKLSQDNGILLDDIPKPPKKGRLFHRLRTVRNC
jgi:HEAT repeat protein